MSRALRPAVPLSNRAGAALIVIFASFSSAAQRPCVDVDQAYLCLRFSSDAQIDNDPSGLRAAIAHSGSARSGGTSAAARGAKLASLQIEYEGGSEIERHAKVVDDPANPGAKVLMFALNSPNVRASNGRVSKGRIQANLYGNRNVRELRETVDLRLGDGFRLLRDYPDTFGWMTISEWWNNAAWSGAQFPFRISVNIVKTRPGSGVPLRLAVHGQTFDPTYKRWHTVWERVNESFELTSGRWMALDYRYIQGGSRDGRFFLSVTPEGGVPTTIFDITNSTHHPDDPSPDGLGHMNPLKLYTSRQTVEFVRDRKSALTVYWRDLDIRACGGTEPGSAVNVAAVDWLPCEGR